MESSFLGINTVNFITSFLLALAVFLFMFLMGALTRRPGVTSSLRASGTRYVKAFGTFRSNATSA